MLSLRPLLLTGLLAGCPSSEEPRECVQVDVDLACAPADDATFDALYTQTLQGSCARSGVSCHAATGRQGGIDFSDPDVAYDDLLARAVYPSRPECSDLVRRVRSTDGNVRMPPAISLKPEEQCAIVKWIAGGAQR